MSSNHRYWEHAKENWPEVSRFLKRFFLVFGLIAVFLVILFYKRIFISVHAGESGVMWRRFLGGTDLKHVYGEGFHIIPPWDILTIYDRRIQQVPHEFVALSKDGLPINVQLSIRFRPVAAELPMLHQDIGPDYVDKVVKPEIQSMVRFVLAQYTPEQIYTSEGFLLNIIQQGALGQILERHILLDDLLIKRLSLPDSVRNAIEGKLVQQQLLQEYVYRLDREGKEAERKRIEAAGIRDFQIEVMKGGAFDKYLRYQGIGATVQLATSNNAKVVVVGSGSDGLPLILNMPDSPVSPEANPKPVSSPTATPNASPETPAATAPHNRPELQPQGATPAPTSTR
jgi:regulator of protease activity HflC (stomatin/prohibitin superfamily)